MAEVEAPSKNAESWRDRLQHHAGLLFLGLWSVGAIVVGATLMVGHWYTLPMPDTCEPALVRALGKLRGSDRDRWLAVHVLYSECLCSRRILDHLVESERPDGVMERVLLIGSESTLEQRMTAAGFAVDVMSPKELKERFGIESAPLFLVVDPAGVVRYGGGYTDRKQGLAVRDLEILASLTQDGVASRYPVFGCGVSQELQALLDPIGIKYQ